MQTPFVQAAIEGFLAPLKRPSTHNRVATPARVSRRRQAGQHHRRTEPLKAQRRRKGKAQRQARAMHRQAARR